MKSIIRSILKDVINLAKVLGLKGYKTLKSLKTHQHHSTKISDIITWIII